MNEQFRQRFEEGMQKTADSLDKKSGVKQLDKVHERIGKLKQKYPSIGRYFDIEIESTKSVQQKVKGKNKDINQDNQSVETLKQQIATSSKWAIKANVDINARRSVYFLRTTLESDSEELLWQCYNIIISKIYILFLNT
jgi:DNA repair ATPase RecN